MKAKIIGIFVCMLLMTSVVPVVSDINFIKNNIDKTMDENNAVISEDEIFISEIYYAGSADFENDFVEFQIWDDNSQTIDITDWYITTYDGDIEYLPYVTGLEQFDYVAIRMGTGTDDLDASDGSATIFLDRTDSMLDVPGDEVGLYTENDELVDFVRYGGGNGDPVLGGWSNSDSGAFSPDTTLSIQMHDYDRDDSSNWLCAPPTEAEPNVVEWLMDLDKGLYYQIHNGNNHPVNLSGYPAVPPDLFRIFDETASGLSPAEINTIREWLNHTYDLMNDSGLGTPQTATDGKVHVHINETNRAPSGVAGSGTKAGHIWVWLGDLSNRNESIMAKESIEHEQVHLVQYNNRGDYGDYEKWSDLEGMAEYWGTEITMDNFDLTFDEYLEIHDEVYSRVGSGYRWNRFLENPDRNFFDDWLKPKDWPSGQEALDHYWANHMLLRYIRYILGELGEEKIKHIFRVRNATSGIEGIIDAINKAFEEEGLSDRFIDIFINWTIWLWETYGLKITLVLDETLDGSVERILENGKLNPWGTDYERVNVSENNITKINFTGQNFKDYAITLVKKKKDGTFENETHRFSGSKVIVVPAGYVEIIIIKRQLGCSFEWDYTINITSMVPFIIEDFEFGLPSDWIIFDYLEDGYTWTDENPGERSPEGGCYGKFMICDSDWAGFENYLLEELWTPSIDCSEATSVYLDFSQYYSHLAEDYAYVDVSNDGGSTWIPVVSYYTCIMGKESIDISDEAVGFSDVRIRWVYDDKGMWAWYWMVDNIMVYGNINDPPNAPIIDGPTSGTAGTSYTYTFISSDPEGDQVSYYIEWGDGDITDWTGFQPSGEPYSTSHVWSEQGAYIIKGKAMDTNGEESDWGTLTVTMPRNRATNTPFLNFLHNFLTGHPTLFPTLRRLLEL